VSGAIFAMISKFSDAIHAGPKTSCALTPYTWATIDFEAHVEHTHALVRAFVPDPCGPELTGLTDATSNWGAVNWAEAMHGVHILEANMASSRGMYFILPNRRKVTWRRYEESGLRVISFRKGAQRDPREQPLSPPCALQGAGRLAPGAQ
jgi:hypothetical protein